MKSSYISRPIHFIDAPVPKKPIVKFEYNFFEADERTSEGSSSQQLIMSLNPRELAIKVPRLNRLSWNQVVFDRKRSIQREVARDFLTDNAEEIADESAILNDTTILYFQDFDHLNRIGERFEASARMRGVLSGSSTDVAAKLNTVTSITTDGDLIQRYLSIASQSRSLFLRDGLMVEPADASSADQLTMVVDNNYLINSTREASMSPVGSAADSIRSNSKTISRSLRRRSQLYANDEEIELELGSVEDCDVSSPGTVRPVEHIGYMIERFEVADGDRIENKKRIFIPSPRITNYLDASIKYGIQYVYSVRTVIAFYATTADESGTLKSSKFLVSSRPSTFSSVITEERIPPPPPADLNFRWDYQLSTMQIQWAFPSNPQRDIKGWQIFRRASVNEPFSLIAQLEFDDSTVKTPPIETVDRSLIKIYNSPITFFTDQEFNKNSNYIYAVCSKDAHGLTSNYGMQFRVSFDRLQNRLIKTLISGSNAPKQYPNMYLRAELSLDSVKSSGAQRVRIYFDPEYLKVTNKEGRDLKFLKTKDANGIYRFMLLNTDRQLQANVDIAVEDLRNLRSAGV